MTLALTLTYGSTTVTLNGSGCKVALGKYSPRAELASVMEVTESIDLVLSGASLAIIQGVIGGINKALYNALLWKTYHQDAPTYLNITPTGGSAYRSEVIEGKLILENTAVAWIEQNLHARATLIVTRVNYWEAASEISVPLTNGNGSSSTTGLTVLNCNDGTGSSPTKKNNYVEILAADVAGDLPGAARLEITNLDASYRISRVWVGHNWTDPANSVQIYEAEDATGEVGLSSAGASGGEYVRKTLSSGSEATLFTWAISSAAMAAAKGQWVHALLRWNQGGWEVNSYFRLKLQWNLTTFWQSAQIKPDQDTSGAFLDLMSFRLPPGLQGLSSLDGMDLILTGQQSSGSSQYIYLDLLALMPADGWRYLFCNGYGVSQNERIVDDGILGYLYADDGSGGDKVAILSGLGEPIRLQPGKLQRLHFFWHSHISNTAPITMAATIKIYYRPRRLTL